MYPLADLFNLSLSTCSVPHLWKCARVTHLFKGGDSSDVNNYRPISIICYFSKKIEKLVFNQLSLHCGCISHQLCVHLTSNELKDWGCLATGGEYICAEVRNDFESGHGQIGPWIHRLSAPDKRVRMQRASV